MIEAAASENSASVDASEEEGASLRHFALLVIQPVSIMVNPRKDEGCDEGGLLAVL